MAMKNVLVERSPLSSIIDQRDYALSFRSSSVETFRVPSFRGTVVASQVELTLDTKSS